MIFKAEQFSSCGQRVSKNSKKMLENRPNDALGSLVETVETVQTVETEETVEALKDCRD